MDNSAATPPQTLPGIRSDLTEYHKSISQELNLVKDRVRNIIGSSHWQSDGEHKEAVLRRILRTHLPESLHVARGFVYFPREFQYDNEWRNVSPQLDILIRDRSKPTLFKDEDLRHSYPRRRQGHHRGEDAKQQFARRGSFSCRHHRGCSIVGFRQGTVWDLLLRSAFRRHLFFRAHGGSDGVQWFYEPSSGFRRSWA